MEFRGEGTGVKDERLALFSAASNKDKALAGELIRKKADVNKRGPVRTAFNNTQSLARHPPHAHALTRL